MRTALALAAVAGGVMCWAGGCDQLNNWRSKQVEESHEIAKGDRIDSPAVEVIKASELADDLPVDESWTILSSSEADNNLTVNALSSWDVQQTSIWMLTRLAQMGYETSDNPSALLGGAIYSSARGRYKSVYVKVGMNNQEQCTVELRGTE